MELCVPTSEPNDDELNGISDDEQAHTILKKGERTFQPKLASERICAEARCRAAQNMPMEDIIQSLNDDSGDEELLEAINTRPTRPRRAATQRSAPYSLKLSLTRPVENEVVQRQRGRPKPLTCPSAPMRSDRFSIQALVREKSRHMRRGTDALGRRAADVIVSTFGSTPLVDALSIDELVSITMESASGTDVEQVKALLAHDAELHEECELPLTTQYWSVAPQAWRVKIAKDDQFLTLLDSARNNGQLAQLLQMGAADVTFSESLVPWLVDVALTEDEPTVLAARAALHLLDSRDVATVCRYVPELLSTLGANSALLQLALGAPFERTFSPSQQYLPVQQRDVFVQRLWHLLGCLSLYVSVNLLTQNGVR